MPERWRFPFRQLPGQPLVSVIMTSYNYEQFVAESIQSVFAQTYRPLELIVVDDGSADHSREIIAKALRDAAIPATLIAQKNAGQAAALNTGFLRARGDLIALLDSDDAWRADKVEAMVAFIRAHPDGGVYQHQLDDGAGHAKQPPPLAEGDYFARWLRRGEVNAATHQEEVSIFLPTTGLMFLREVLERVFPIPEALTTCPDAYLTRTSCVYGPVHSLGQTLGTWRSHDSNAGRRSGYSFRTFWAPVVMPAINRYYETHGIPVCFVYRPWAILREPPHRMLQVLLRRVRRTLR